MSSFFIATSCDLSKKTRYEIFDNICGFAKTQCSSEMYVFMYVFVSSRLSSLIINLCCIIL